MGLAGALGMHQARPCYWSQTITLKDFSSKSKKAGRKWAKFYLKCYPDIRVKKASNLSIARAMAANEPNVHKWFDEYEHVLKDLGINSPKQIWSGEETGVQNVPKKQLVVGATGTPANQTVSGKQERHLQYFPLSMVLV